MIASWREVGTAVIKMMMYSMRLLRVDKIIQASQKLQRILIFWADIMM